jgi:toxin HigB-1
VSNTSHWRNKTQQDYREYLTVDIINALRYARPVIKSFANKLTAEIWKSGNTKGGPPASVTRRKLAMLDAATKLEDLRIPPGNRLEKLAGDRHGQHSIRINDQYRICFVWRGNDAFDIEITDYH